MCRRVLERRLVVVERRLLFGGLVGAVVGLGAHWASEGRPDFFSSTSIRAGRYDLVARTQVAANAARLLSESPTPVSTS